MQAARISYGFSGIYDEDEAERIIEGVAVVFMSNHSKETHTPGPWIAQRKFQHGTFQDFRIEGKDKERVLVLRGGMAPCEADALLIAAAPDLLAACEKAASLAWEVGCETDDGVYTLLEDSRGDLFRLLSAAITKAKGKAP